MATDNVKKGELLIRLPENLVISGERDPVQFNDETGTQKTASPWLRCLSALLRMQRTKNTDACGARKSSNSGTTTPQAGSLNSGLPKGGGPSLVDQDKTITDHGPYLRSLPSRYETIMSWSDDEVSSFLSGTGLGRMVQSDREQGMLQSRYKIGVRPYLKFVGIVTNDVESKDEFERFKLALMCLSTRAFNLRREEDGTGSMMGETGGSCTSLSTYSGPFLLPYIDLLNHSRQQKCTTLQRDPSDGSFYMIAERDVIENEEVYHSYGDDLTSGQLLQTFGFVDREAMALAACEGAHLVNATPALLSKEAVTLACMSVAKSAYPSQLRAHIEAHEMVDETWNLPSDVSSRSMPLIPDDIVVSLDCPMPRELISLCCFNFLPPAAFNEFIINPVLLDKGILEDYFLGKLVCRSILMSVQNKLAQYDSTANRSGSSQRNLSGSDDAEALCLSRMLQELEANLKAANDKAYRSMYGHTIRLEEKSCLFALREEVMNFLDFLDDEGENGDDERVCVTIADSSQALTQPVHGRAGIGAVPSNDCSAGKEETCHKSKKIRLF